MKKKFKVGNKIKVIANKGGHNYEIGEVYKVVKIYNDSLTAKSLDGKFVGNSLYGTEIEFVSLTIDELKEDNESLKANIAEIQKEIEDNNLKIAWMEENGVSEYDENQFKAFRTLSLLEDETLSKLEKAKLIGELVSQ
jgi:hypothetical protein